MVNINLIKVGTKLKINFEELQKDSVLPPITIANLRLFDAKYKGIHKATKIFKNVSKNQKIELEEDFWFFPNELDLA